MSDHILKPCPFCGGTVELERAFEAHHEIYGRRQFWGVVCRNTTNVGGSCCMEQVPSASQEAAVARWNRRPESLAAQQIEPKAVLTDDVIRRMAMDAGVNTGDRIVFARAIEAAAGPNAALVEAAQRAYAYLFATGLKTKYPAEFKTCSHLSDKLRHALVDVGASLPTPPKEAT